MASYITMQSSDAELDEGQPETDSEQSETSFIEFPSDFHDLWNDAPLVSIHPVFGRNAMVTGLYVMAEVVATIWLACLAFRMPPWLVEISAHVSFSSHAARFLLSIFIMGNTIGIANCIVSVRDVRQAGLQEFMNYVDPFIIDDHRRLAFKKEVCKSAPLSFVGFCVAVILPLLGFWLAKAPHYWRAVFLMFLPFAIPVIGADSAANLVGIITSLCRYRAMSFCTALEDQAKNPEPPSWHFWRQQCKDHYEMDRQFEKVWKIVSVQLSLNLMGQTLLGILCLGIVLVGDSLHFIVTVCIICLIVAVGALLQLRPAAEVTSLCQNMGPGARSIRSTTNYFIKVDMDPRAQQEWLAFSAYLDRTPTGVEIPLVGVVSYAFIASKIGLVLTLGPPGLAIMRKMLASG